MESTTDRHDHSDNDNRVSRKRSRSKTGSSERSSSVSSATLRKYFNDFVRSNIKKRRRSPMPPREKTERLPAYVLRASELKWKSDLDRRQYEFNEKTLDSLRIVVSNLETIGSRPKQAIADLQATIGDILQRQKLIRFADRSTGGWAAAYEYDKDDLADDSSDERRLRSAESRALKKKKDSSKTGRFSGFAGQSSRGSLGGWRGNYYGGPYRGNVSTGFNDRFRGSNNSSRGCYKCGSRDHWVSRCPLQFGSQRSFAK